MTRARRLCPQAVVVAPDFETFGRVSASVMETFRQVTPVVEVISLDEAFLDVRGSIRRLGSPLRDRRAAARDRSTTSSASPARSGWRRRCRSPSWPAAGPSPTACVVVPPDEVTSFLHPLDVGELWGVGEKTRAMLHRLGLITVGDVAHTPLRTLQRAVGDAPRQPPAPAGLGDGPAGGHRPRAGPTSRTVAWGREETFGRDTDDREVVLRELLRLSARVAGRMRAARVAGRTVTLTVRFADFTTITRSRTLPEATDVHPGDLPRRRRGCTTPSGCSGAGSGWWGCGWRDWCRGRRCTGSWSSGSASTAGPTPTGPSTGPPCGSGPPRCGRPRLLC